MGVNGPAGVPLSAGLTASALDSSISASSNSFIGSVNSNNTRLEQPQLQEQHLPSPLPSTVAALASLSATSSSALSSSGGTDIFNPSQQMHSGHTHQTLHQSSFPRNYTSSTNMSSLPPVSASVASTSENISQHALRSSSMSPTVAATATSSSSFFSHAPPLSTTSSAMGIGIGGYVPPSLPASSSVIDPSLPSSSYDPASTINSTTTSTTNYYNNNISAGGAPPPPPPPPAPVTASTIPLSAIPPSQIPSYMASSAHLLENINMAIAASNPLGSVMAAGGGASSGIAASTIMSAADSMPSINDPSTAGEQMAKRFEAIRANKAAAPAKVNKRGETGGREVFVLSV